MNIETAVDLIASKLGNKFGLVHLRRTLTFFSTILAKGVEIEFEFFSRINFFKFHQERTHHVQQVVSPENWEVLHQREDHSCPY